MKGRRNQQKQLKKQLAEAFEAPEPLEKEAFLSRAPLKRVSIGTFLTGQLPYLPKRSLLSPAAALLAAEIGRRFFDKNFLWFLSAWLPLLALTIVTESGRSERFGMAELELSARFSLKSVTLARLVILGGVNLVSLCLLSGLTAGNTGSSLLQTGAYLLCPYLMSAFLGLLAARRIRGREASYVCAGIAAVVSVGNLMLQELLPVLYEADFLKWWWLLAAALGAGVGKEIYKMLKQTEELVWN